MVDGGWFLVLFHESSLQRHLLGGLNVRIMCLNTLNDVQLSTLFNGALYN